MHLISVYIFPVHFKQHVLIYKYFMCGILLPKKKIADGKHKKKFSAQKLNYVILGMN